MAPQTTDPFDDLLTLEDTLYTTAHDQGVADGARAGRIEGRIFGLEKGFEKFSALGELHGRGAVWGSRSQSVQPKPAVSSSLELEAKTEKPLPPLGNSSTRLQSNVSLLYHLTDPLTFSTSNTEADVADFDDRFKRAGAKAKVVERIVGESLPTTAASTDSRSPDGSPGPAKGRNVRLEGEAKRGGKKGDDSMEDFVGSRLIG